MPPARDQPAVPNSFTLSSSSVVLPGRGRDGSKSKSRKPTYWQSVASIGIQVADAVEYAHKQGVQHRDIKPSNLLLDTQGTVWVADFGLAKADDQQNLTQTGDILGTLRYMPPEAFEGKADARGDVYSLGLTLYEKLAFRPAFDEKEQNRLIRQVTQQEPPRLGKSIRSLPRDLETIVSKAIDREPGRRYQTAGLLAADLQRFVDDEPIRARRSSPDDFRGARDRGLGGKVALSPDNTWLAVSGATTVWDMHQRKLLLALPAEHGFNWGLTWSPNRELLAAGFSDGSLVIWNIPRIRAGLAEIGLNWHDSPVPAPPEEQARPVRTTRCGSAPGRTPRAGSGSVDLSISRIGMALAWARTSP
jgi:serine/threonine protein kinase